jgi:hypothetical protein
MPTVTDWQCLAELFCRERPAAKVSLNRLLALFCSFFDFAEIEFAALLKAAIESEDTWIAESRISHHFLSLQLEK